MANQFDSAARKGELDFIKEHIKEYTNKDHNEALFEAVKRGCQEIVKFLLENSANVNYQDTFGETPLCLAVKNKNIEMIKILLEAGANINHKDRFDYTILSLALKTNDAEVVKVIVSHPQIDLNEKDLWDRNIVDLAIANRASSEVVKVLKEAVFSATPKAEEMSEKIEKITAEGLGQGLFKAVERGNIFKVETLLESGADINCVNEEGLTPLFIAVGNNNTEMASFLLMNGANANAKDITLRSVLHKAVEVNSPELVEILLEAGAVSSCRDEMGKSVMELVLDMRDQGIDNNEVENLIFFADYNEREEKIKNKNNSPKMTTGEEKVQTPNQKFIESAEKGDIEYIKNNLEKTKLDIRIRAFVRTPSIIISELLLQSGVHIDAMESGDMMQSVARKSWSYSALAFACMNNNINKAFWLIEKGADVNIPYIDKLYVAGMANVDDEDNFSPLMIAIEKQNEQLFDSLLKAGADVNYQGHRGDRNGAAYTPETPLDTAFNTKGLAFVERLETLGAERVKWIEPSGFWK